ncbi:MAG: hypothetical protein ABF649_11270 [Bacillus sp. (in: firmicutes)]
MKKSKWNDEQLEGLIKQLPKVKDNRHPSTIKMCVEAKQKKQLKRHWIIPTVATLCSLFLFIIIVNSVMNNGTSINEEKSSLHDRNMFALINTGDDIQKSENKQEANFADKLDVSMETNVIYPEDINGKEILTYPIPDKNLQVVVPVSVLVDKELNSTKFDLYKDLMNKLTEEKWGLMDYYPVKADLSFDANKKEVHATVTKDPSVFPSNGDNFYYAIIQEQMKEVNAKKVLFSTNNQPGINFGNFGKVTFINYRQLEKRGYFLFDAGEERKNAYYVPSLDSYESIEMAFHDMQKDNKVLGLSASLPDTIHFEKIVSNPSKNQLIVALTKDSKLEENNRTLQAIESILLTAKDFHFSTVKFENANIKQIGRFTLTKEVSVPVAANKRDIH